jgi:tetratricopeptide (TPR) repeat protein
MPLYAAYLAKIFWESRKQNIKNKIRVQNQFPELAQIFAYFYDAENAAFLKSARLRFEADFHTNMFPSFILHRYVSMLDRNNADDFHLIIQLLQKCLAMDPTDYGSWISLANIYEWGGDIERMLEALKGAMSSDPLDSKTKLRLAYGHVLLEQYADAKSVLELIDTNRIRYDADLSFCLGALAEWEGETTTALEFYQNAIEIRRYKPIYHLKYGKLLLQEGLKEEARKALEWAARIDAGEKIKQEAEMLLSKL